ncbi:MAG: hypothetical protein A3I66_10365 [Burkholderiales bacterium RIFCSPLOWO2_02_FULL_57_36]|nr:MAG: hypothetical protein A3I66_10365 [Burkholderiales bacterium RIFCSPLOWO2_02_FULL_57_36]
MRDLYIQKYKEDQHARASLQLLTHYLFPHLSLGKSVIFAFTFARLGDRCLYHSLNVWAKFILNLNVPPEILDSISADGALETGDKKSKYEIEAFLAAAKSLTEENLMGIDTQSAENLLGEAFGQHPDAKDGLRAIFAEKKLRFGGIANQVRNHAYLR